MVLIEDSVEFVFFQRVRSTDSSESEGIREPEEQEEEEKGEEEGAKKKKKKHKKRHSDCEVSSG